MQRSPLLREGAERCPTETCRVGTPSGTGENAASGDLGRIEAGGPTRPGTIIVIVPSSLDPRQRPRMDMNR
jgi:hypothetical protein